MSTLKIYFAPGQVDYIFMSSENIESLSNDVRVINELSLSESVDERRFSNFIASEVTLFNIENLMRKIRRINPDRTFDLNVNTVQMNEDNQLRIGDREDAFVIGKEELLYVLKEYRQTMIEAYDFRKFHNYRFEHAAKYSKLYGTYKVLSEFSNIRQLEEEERLNAVAYAIYLYGKYIGYSFTKLIIRLGYFIDLSEEDFKDRDDLNEEYQVFQVNKVIQYVSNNLEALDIKDVPQQVSRDFQILLDSIE
jgi:hypothetical protein